MTWTGKKWCRRYGVTFDWSSEGYQLDESNWEYHSYTLLLAYPGATLTLPYRAGIRVEEEPNKNLLWMHAGDCRYGMMTWEEFADEFGYDKLDAPLSQYRSWQACQTIATEVMKFCEPLPGAWDDFLAIEEDS